MSQEAEYYVRNLTYGEARDLAHRIAGQERAAAERQAQEMVERESRRLANRMHGELAGVRNEVDRRQLQLQQQLDCNRHLTEALQARVSKEDQALEDHQKALRALAEHDREIERQIERNRQVVAELSAQQAATERRLHAEISSRRAEREQHARSVFDQRRLALHLFESLPVQRFQSAGLRADLAALRSSLDRGLVAATQPANEQAALALLLEVQNKADGLVIELDRRENEISVRRESSRLALEAARIRLAQLRSDKDVVTVFARPIGVIEAKLNECSVALDALQKAADQEFSRLLAHWERLVADTRGLQEELERLWNDHDRVLDQVRERNRLVRSVIKSLIDVWGGNFELDHMYATTDVRGVH